MKARFTLLIGVLAALVTLITSSVAANAVYEMLFKVWWPELERHKGWATLGLLSLFSLSFLVLFRNRQVFQAVRGLNQEVCNKPLPCVVLLLSPPGRHDFSCNENPFCITVGDKLIPTTLERDIAQLEGTGWPWQQMLRGLLPHGKDDTLKHIYLIGSSDTKTRQGSFSSLYLAKNLIQHYFPTAKVESHPSAVHFENFDALADTLSVALKKLKKHFREKEITVDVTGGQKTTSIAGAVVTFKSGVTFQYVQTDEPYEVIKYDVVIESPPSL